MKYKSNKSNYKTNKSRAYQTEVNILLLRVHFLKIKSLLCSVLFWPSGEIPEPAEEGGGGGHGYPGGLQAGGGDMLIAHIFIDLY